MLEERFGNTQVLISTHMNVLLKLPKLNNDNVTKLTSLYNAVESNIRSLMTMGLNPSHYGPLLIPVILERLPDSIKLIVTRKLGKNNWHISDFINCIKEEIDARENCDFMKGKNDYEHLRNTTHLLLVCVFFRLSQNETLHMPYLRSSVGIISNSSTERIMESCT